jgi:translation initiation factor IF-2
MPQTIEAVSHARAAGVPIVVAINKIDKPTANLETVKRQLAEQGLLIEEWGGQTICSPISAKKREGISELLENLLIAAEMLGLKADPDAPPEGVVIEAELDKTRGPTATILVHNGTLKVADILVVGSTWGKVKAMFNDKGKRIRQAGPATPVKILGLNDVPRAGDTITSVANEKEAKILVQNRLQNQKKGKLAKPLSLDELFEQIRQGKAKELNIVLKTDVQGSIEPIKNSLEKLSRDDIKVKVIHSGTGELSEGDVMLALASKGVVIGFNTKPTLGAQKLGEMEKVDIRCYQVIYQIIDDIERALKGMKEPSWVEVLEGQAEIRAIFPSDKYGRVAGAYIKQGKASQGASVKIKRRGELITQTTLTSLKRFKEDVKEAATGFECGIGLKEFNQFEVGDIIEFYRKEKE